MLSAEAKQGALTVANTIFLILLTIIGALVSRTMTQFEKKLESVVQDITTINIKIQQIQSDRDYERGRMAGIKEALEAQEEGKKR